MYVFVTHKKYDFTVIFFWNISLVHDKVLSVLRGGGADGNVHFSATYGALSTEGMPYSASKEAGQLTTAPPLHLLYEGVDIYRRTLTR